MIQKEFDKKLFKTARKPARFFKGFKFGSSKRKINKKNNLFYLADLFGNRQKEKIWLAYQKELFEGTLAEEVFWKLLWQVKSLMLVKKGEGNGLHPFVLNKVKKSAPLFTEEELQKYSSNLVDLFHQSRHGQADLAVGLEKFILKI
ncbi:hypothetical protein ACFL1O_00055 [Patescibacteria group bacterium]